MSADRPQPRDVEPTSPTSATPPGGLPPLVPLSEASGLCGGPGQLSCDEANELIQTYLDHAVDPDTGEKLTEHLGDCPPCEHEFVVYQRIVDALARCRPDVPADTKQRLKQYCTSLCEGEVEGVQGAAEPSAGAVERPGGTIS